MAIKTRSDIVRRLFIVDIYGETYSFRGEIIICPECNGQGVHCHAIDGNGIGDEDHDPDFMEDYFSGRYDRQCDLCEGQGRIVDVNPALLKGEDLKNWKEYIEEEASEIEMEECMRAERRMGA